MDGSAHDLASDGYATGLVTLALQPSRSAQPSVRRGLEWLVKNQDPRSGRWSASSLNKRRDPESDAARFMGDAATGFAVLALTNALPAR